jgi:hypothetical protein
MQTSGVPEKFRKFMKRQAHLKPGRPKLAAVKILRVSYSMDFWREVPVDQRVPAILERMLAERTGEETEVHVRGPRLRPESDKMLDEWLHDIEPDICIIHANPFWYAFESPAVQLRRSRGPLRSAGTLARKASETKWLRGTPVYGIAKRVAQKAVGGSYLLETDQAIRVYTYWLRAILRREVIVPGLFGPTGVILYDPDRARWDRMEARRVKVSRALAATCDELQVLHETPIEEIPGLAGKEWLGPDGMHPTAAYHRVLAEYQFDLYLAAWRQLRNKPEASTA